jgi:hypothetical protein
LTGHGKLEEHHRGHHDVVNVNDEQKLLRFVFHPFVQLGHDVEDLELTKSPKRSKMTAMPLPQRRKFEKIKYDLGNDMYFRIISSRSNLNTVISNCISL